MRRTFLISILLHGLTLAALWRWETPTQPSDTPDQLAVVEVLLSDPTRGNALAEETPTATDTPTPETATPPSPQPDTTMAEIVPATPLPPEPTPESPPTPPETITTQAPTPPPPPPARSAPPPTPPTPRAAPLAVRVGASSSGRDDGRTDIVTGQNVVEAAIETTPANVPPRYPPEAVRRGQQGHVGMQVLVGTDGAAISVNISETSGYPLLDRAAREAVAKWRFRPGSRDGLAIPSTVSVLLSFRLENRQ